MTDTLSPTAGDPTPQSARRTDPARNTRHRRGRALLIAIIVILLLSLCAIGAVVARLVMPSSADVASEADAGGIEWVRSIYGFGETASQMLVRPAKVEVADDGGIYVVDQEHRFVMRFSISSGSMHRVSGSTSAKATEAPSDSAGRHVAQ